MKINARLSFVALFFALFCLVGTSKATQEQTDPVIELSSSISQKYQDLETIQKQFDQAKWEETAVQNLHDNNETNIIRKMQCQGIEIATLEVPHIDRFFVTSVAVNDSGLENFLGIDIGASLGDVEKIFGTPHEIQDNRFIYSDMESGYLSVYFVFENDGVVAEMRYDAYVD